MGSNWYHYLFFWYDCNTLFPFVKEINTLAKSELETAGIRIGLGGEGGTSPCYAEFRWLLWLTEMSRGWLTVSLCGEIRQEESLALTAHALEGTQPTWQRGVFQLSSSLQRLSHSSCLPLTPSARVCKSLPTSHWLTHRVPLYAERIASVPWSFSTSTSPHRV